jgi:hypothetical protein
VELELGAADVELELELELELPTAPGAGLAAPLLVPPPPQAASRARPVTAIRIGMRFMGPTIRRWRYGRSPPSVKAVHRRVNVR